MKYSKIFTLIIFFTFIGICRAQFSISIDGKKDPFYDQLQDPNNGYLYISNSDFLPLSGPMPSTDSDLSASVWVAWDTEFFYIYAEVKDDTVVVNNPNRFLNDCIELKFDPNPKMKALSGIVSARLTALDSARANNQHGVDNLYSEGNLPEEAVSIQNYARRLTDNGYALEFRLAWEWIKTEDRFVNVGVGEVFGLSVTFHDNDSNKRDGSIQWSAGMADEVWTTPQLLGSVEFLTNHKLKLVKRNAIDPTARPGKTYLSSARFERLPGEVVLLENWKFHPGDDFTWADPAYNDSLWETYHPILSEDRIPESGWNGIGWFRIHINVDSSLWNVPLGLSIMQAGASEVYLDGELLYGMGQVSSEPDSEQVYWERNPRFIVFKNQPNHLLALRYSNFTVEDLSKINLNPGFAVYIIADFLSVISNRISIIRTFSFFQIIFTVIPLVLGLIHLLIFIFYPIAKENLYFSIFMFCWAIIAFTDFSGPFYTDFKQIISFGQIGMLAVCPAIVFGLLTGYVSISSKIPKQIFFFIALGLILIIWFILDPAGRIQGIMLYILIGLAALETFRLIFMSGFTIWRERWITLLGFSAFMLALVYQILSNIEILPRVGEYGIAYVYGLHVLSISMSIDLSRSFARTRKDLEKKLVQVEDLSQKTLEQERRSKEEEIARKLLEAENLRKTQELEEARKLQLSMLPKDIPSLPNLDIATYMQPATEVGGDYYDFHIDDDGTLTVAIGDATGHGMKAGTMVATIKGLFKAFGSKLDILSFFNTCTSTIKDMHWGNLYMAMMLVSINKEKMIAASAGMPHMLIHRNKTQTIEEVVLRGMPLGAYAGFTYKLKEIELAPGDTILLMSDGLPELFNDKLEILDYPTVKELFKEVASQNPNEIIEYLNQASERWSGGRPQNDDITFVVLKFKDS